MRPAFPHGCGRSGLLAAIRGEQNDGSGGGILLVVAILAHRLLLCTRTGGIMCKKGMVLACSRGGARRGFPTGNTDACPILGLGDMSVDRGKEVTSSDEGCSKYYKFIEKRPHIAEDRHSPVSFRAECSIKATGGTHLLRKYWQKGCIDQDFPVARKGSSLPTRVDSRC
jgi:hypothetical protein